MSIDAAQKGSIDHVLGLVLYVKAELKLKLTDRELLETALNTYTDFVAKLSRAQAPTQTIEIKWPGT